MDTDLKKMMIAEPKAKNAKNQRLPPTPLSLASFDAMDTDLKKMMIAEPKAKNAKNQRLPPRRGGVKRRIVKVIAGAIGVVVVGGIRQKHSEETGGGFLSSDSTTPAPTPTGYNSDALSET